jgi:tRNA (guanosine-2'-O-)-methyltransferase
MFYLCFRLVGEQFEKIMDHKTKQDFLKFLYQFITENKQNHFERVIKDRTRYLTVVLEDIFQPHNASAVLRSCDVFGVQDIHIVENRYQYRINPDVALGSSKWLDLHKYNESEFNTTACLEKLKKEDYRIVATTPHKDDVTIQDLSLEKGKIALLFGTEYEGLTQQALDLADEYVMIPMYGFTESLNISVTAAIFLYHLTHKLKHSDIAWALSREEVLDLKIRWAKNVVKNSEIIERQFINRQIKG